MTKIFMGVSMALSYIHEKRIFHQDIKPQNILLDGYGRAVLTDFGLASKLKEGQNSVTSWHTTIGHYGPELCLGRRFCPFKLDMYSFGITLWKTVFKLSSTAFDPFTFTHTCTSLVPYFKDALLKLLHPVPCARWDSGQFENHFRSTPRSTQIFIMQPQDPTAHYILLAQKRNPNAVPVPQPLAVVPFYTFRFGYTR